MPRVLLLLPTRSYRAPDFLEAAGRLGVQLVIGSEETNALSAARKDAYLRLDWERPEAAAEAYAQRLPLDAVLGVDDATTAAAARIAARLGLPGNPVEAIEAARDKGLMRERLRRAGLPSPSFQVHDAAQDPRKLARLTRYPCVLKPTRLAASQGVIRADGPAGFVRAWRRIARIIESEGCAPQILVEDFLPGREVALEGLLERGRLKVLAVFDKPDPLNGPYFEETLYVRPSRLAPKTLERVERCAALCARALGLLSGPVHAEFRVHRGRAWVLELAPRPIGGRCSRTLRFDLGLSLEELVLRQALGVPAGAKPDPAPSGVMMIPCPGRGVLRSVEGVDQARKVPGIVEVMINVRPGQELRPLPEGSAYTGFIFASASSPARVEAALRRAHARLRFRLS